MAVQQNVQTSTPGAARSAPVGPAGGAGTPGETVIQDGVIAKIAGIAVREVPGVYGLGGGVARAIGAVRDAVGSTDLSQGVSVEVGEKQVAFDVTVVAEYPVPLQQIGAEVRAAVTRAITELVGLEITEVNVTITDVHVAADDEVADEARVQ